MQKTPIKLRLPCTNDVCHIGMNPPGLFAINNLITASSDPHRLFLTYLHCLYEAKCTKTLRQFDSKFEVSFQFYRLSYHDLNVIWNFMLDIVEKCQPVVVYFNFQFCDINDRSIDSAITTLINQADTLNCSVGYFVLNIGDAGITYNGVRSLTKLMTVKNVSLIGLFLSIKIEFLTLNMLIDAITNSNIIALGLTSSIQSMLTSRHVYHLILLIYQARHLQKLDLSGNFMLAESVSLLMIAARNVKYLVFKYLLGDQQLLDIGPLLAIKYYFGMFRYRIFFLSYTYTFKSLCEFIKVITAPESRSQLRLLVTEYTEDIYANKELMTIVNKFCERRDMI